MNTTHVPEPHRTDEQHTENQPHWRKILDIAPIVSIAFPAIMYFTSDKDSFEDSLFLRFITILLPFSYSAVQYAVLLHTNWKPHNKPERILQSTLYYTLNLLFLAFSIISILSITTLPINKWKNDGGPILFSIFLPPLFMSPTYLLSTSCRLVPGQIGFTDTGINVLIDIPILLCSLVSLVLIIALEETECCYCFAIISSILILIRLLREKLSPEKQSPPPTAPWRIAVFVLILISIVIAYALLAYLIMNVGIFHDYSSLFDKIKNIFSSKPDE
ncbi:DUF2463 domain-containing protein [Encephalitozoon cuniculi]|nr:DUF2463 domain-containing protein [Encephalitozoon cuniculi]